MCFLHPLEYLYINKISNASEHTKSEQLTQQIILPTLKPLYEATYIIFGVKNTWPQKRSIILPISNNDKTNSSNH